MCEHSVERLQALLRTMSVTWMGITDTQRAYTVDMTKSDDSVAKWRERGKTARGGEERQARKKKSESVRNFKLRQKTLYSIYCTELQTQQKRASMLIKATCSMVAIYDVPIKIAKFHSCKCCSQFVKAWASLMLLWYLWHSLHRDA